MLFLNFFTKKLCPAFHIRHRPKVGSNTQKCLDQSTTDTQSTDEKIK